MNSETNESIQKRLKKLKTIGVVKHMSILQTPLENLKESSKRVI